MPVAARPRARSVMGIVTLAGVWAAVLAAGAGCAPRPQMCTSEPECGTSGSCVAGRCVARGSVPAIATARRVLVAPVDVGFVRPGDATSPSHAVVPLGRRGGGVLFLRFALALPPEATVLEAYIVLERAPLSDDPAPVALHAERIAAAWDSRTLSWATQPKTIDVDAPGTRVGAAAGPLVRVDVRDIVQRWRRRGHEEHGIAILADGESATGVSIVLAPEIGPSALPGPQLELYVR